MGQINFDDRRGDKNLWIMVLWGHFSWLLASGEGAIKAELPPLRLQRVGLNFRGTDNEKGENRWEVRNTDLLFQPKFVPNYTEERLWQQHKLWF